MLINISNDGYLGPTAVIRQHLANAVFRAVENGRPVCRLRTPALLLTLGQTVWQEMPRRPIVQTSEFGASLVIRVAERFIRLTVNGLLEFAVLLRCYR